MKCSCDLFISSIINNVKNGIHEIEINNFYEEGWGLFIYDSDTHEEVFYDVISNSEKKKIDYLLKYSCLDQEEEATYYYTDLSKEFR